GTHIPSRHGPDTHGTLEWNKGGRVESSAVGTQDVGQVKAMKVLASTCGLLLSAAFTVTAGELLTIAVSPLRSFAPTNVTARVRVRPNADHRGREPEPPPPNAQGAAGVRESGRAGAKPQPQR